RTSPLLAQRVAVLPAAAVLAVALEARGVLALRSRNARAAVGIALPIFEWKSLQVDVCRRIRIPLRRRGRRRAGRSRRRRADRSNRCASGRKRNRKQERTASEACVGHGVKLYLMSAL